MGGRDQNDQDRKRMTGWWRAAPLLGLYRPALVAVAVGLLFSVAGAAAVARWENRVNNTARDDALWRSRRSSRRLITLIFAGRNRMLMIRQEVPRLGAQVQSEGPTA